MVDKTWLITGGCGFIGTRLIRTLREIDDRFRVRVLDNLAVGNVGDLRAVCAVDDLGRAAGEPPPVRPGLAQFVCGDIKDPQVVAAAMSGVDIVVHLAANTGVGPSVEDPRADCLNNVIGTLNALDAARHAGARRFIFASSGAPVGEVTPPIHEEVVPRPVSPYGASKLAGEAYCSAYARTFDLETVCLRFGNVYGPGSKHKSSVVAKFIKDALASGVLHINGDGSQTRDFIYVDDLIGAVLAAARIAGAGGEIFQIATARETSVGEIAELVSAKLALFGVPAPRVVYETPRKGDVARNYSDTSKAWRMLGWRAATGVEAGIEKTIRSFMESGVAALQRAGS
jgi:UDP-glucose 4-epimerase